eukprot:3644880-Prymnesium_polylepis.1
MCKNIGGDVPDLSTTMGPSLRRAMRLCERSDPPVNVVGLSSEQIKCAAWLCSYTHKSHRRPSPEGRRP